MSAKQASTTLVISVIVTLGLYYLPYGFYVAYPLMLLSTLVHELGHGVAAVLMGGNFHEFKMWGDGSGVAYWSGDVGAAARAFISAGGLVGPAVGAALGLVCARNPRSARWFLGVLGGLLALALLLVVRNGFGFFFIGIFAAICLAVSFKASNTATQLTLVFLSVQLALSVYSRSDYLFMRYADTSAGKMPSDVEHMAMALGLPYWFWGAICIAISVAALLGGGWYFLRSSRVRAPRPTSPARRGI